MENLSILLNDLNLSTINEQNSNGNNHDNIRSIIKNQLDHAKRLTTKCVQEDNKHLKYQTTRPDNYQLENEMKELIQKEMECRNVVMKKCTKIQKLKEKIEYLQSQQDQRINQHNIITEVFNELFNLTQYKEKGLLNINRMSKLFDVHIGMKPLNLNELEDWLVQFRFAEEKLVILSYNCASKQFKLLDITPIKPEKFQDIQEFLLKTNDIIGLLYQCRKYYCDIPTKTVTGEDAIVPQQISN